MKKKIVYYYTRDANDNIARGYEARAEGRALIKFFNFNFSKNPSFYSEIPKNIFHENYDPE